MNHHFIFRTRFGLSFKRCHLQRKEGETATMVGTVVLQGHFASGYTNATLCVCKCVRKCGRYCSVTRTFCFRLYKCYIVCYIVCRCVGKGKGRDLKGIQFIIVQGYSWTGEISFSDIIILSRFPSELC